MPLSLSPEQLGLIVQALELAAAVTQHDDPVGALRRQQLLLLAQRFAHLQPDYYVLQTE
ncbi:hypothetical protein [Amantichitinum ursilacus]|uniref:Uncharacterized protein n=1 Tax=Amantichitinum ursilacus TaxID=857265 RepID=A0A0N0GL74_9NEIS|nr:hypothetical protein [Amantichitinum ursilacus]KPC49637.1 hypothetical protein WG78_19980 [Amantichitinum ursilacus]